MSCTLQENCTAGPSESLVPVKDFAQLLVDAGFEDVMTLDVSRTGLQRDFDTLVLATARSAQHAFAGAKAVRYMLKRARVEAGVAKDVPIAHDSTTAWYSVASGPVSVHCMSREIREQLNLEGLWGEGATVAWHQRGPSAMTLDNFRISEDPETHAEEDKLGRADREVAGGDRDA
jgi:ribosomal silencing factor RsfS